MAFEISDGNFCGIVPMAFRGNKFVVEAVAITNVVLVCVDISLLRMCFLRGKPHLVEMNDECVICIN